MRGRLALGARAFGAILGLVVAVAGLPMLLLAIAGNPLPSSLPSIAELRVILTQSGDGLAPFLIGLLALLVWFLWAQLMIALVVETVAIIRRREATRLPTAPGIQALAARLVASVTLAATLMGGPGVTPALGALELGRQSPGLVVDALDRAESSDHAGPAARSISHPELIEATEVPATGEARVLLLRERAELWDIAELAYGDGMMWKTLAAVNAGALDASGDLITTETASVAPGTMLQVPGDPDVRALTELGDIVGDSSGDVEGGTAPDATSLDPISDDVGTTLPAAEEMVVWTAASTHVVQSGESMWSIAEDRVAADPAASPSTLASYWEDVVHANRDVPSGDVDLIHPGDELILPPMIAPAATPASVVESAVPMIDGPIVLDEPDLDGVQDGPVDAGFVQRTLESVSDSDIDANQRRMSGREMLGAEPDAIAGNRTAPTSVAGSAVGLTALGGAMFAAGVVGALRRRRAIQRRQRIPGDLPLLPSPEAAAFEAALVHAADQVVRSETGAGWKAIPASALEMIPDVATVELRVSRSGGVAARPLNEGVEPADLIDLTAPDPSSDDVAADSDRTPASFMVGADAVTGEAVLLDLVSPTSVDVSGDSTDVARLLRSIVLDLAVSDRVDDVYVIAAGIAGEIADLERVRSVATIEDALVAAARTGHVSGDSTTPVIVVADTVSDPDVAAAIVALGAHVIGRGLTSASTRIEVEGSSAEIAPGGTIVDLVAPDDVGYNSIVELIEVTAAGATAAACEVVVDQPLQVVSDPACDIEPGSVEVRVLGPVEVQGAGAFSSVKAVDVVTFLAFHRNGADADQIKTWVWPSFDPPTDKAFANVLSRARTALGTDHNGEPLLSRAGADRTYRLSSEVVTDFDRFRAFVEQADAAERREDELAALSRALDLIRGVPFTGGTASSFAWADNHVRAHVEFVVDEAVHRCADLALALDDVSAARQAAFKGLEVVPGCEQCFRRRFLVAGANNNRAELKRAMSDLERTAAAELGEPEAIDSISADLLALYHELDQSLISGSA